MFLSGYSLYFNVLQTGEVRQSRSVQPVAPVIKQNLKI